LSAAIAAAISSTRTSATWSTAGEWRAAKPFTGHASFHIWAAYSFSPNASWGQIAREFVAAKSEGHEALKTFVNTVLGETWKEKGDAPDWERIYDRREEYAQGRARSVCCFSRAGSTFRKIG
jgi:phage terminase large subunit GpA-like protein